MENSACSLCGKITEDLVKSSSKNNVCICTNCLNKTFDQNQKKTTSKALTPKLIYKSISKSIIGQDDAKKAISIAIATHYRRLEDPLIEKSNILLIGPTGSGKTEIARTISKLFGLPMIVADATTFTAHGYVGEDVESVIYQLLNACDWDLKRAETGIIFIDEIDKLSRSQEGSGGANIGTVRVQQSLLKMIEGGKIKITKQKKTQGSADEFVMFDTSKVLFICAGAFPGLIEKETKKEIGIGISISNVSKDEKNENVDYNKLLINYGLIPEFIGRLPVIIQTKLLEVNQLIDILTKTDNCLTKQYERLMNSYGVQIEFSQKFLKKVAEEAYTNGTGARGLRSIMEKKLEDLLFEGPSIGTNKKAVIKENGAVLYKDCEEVVLNKNINKNKQEEIEEKKQLPQIEVASKTKLNI